MVKKAATAEPRPAFIARTDYAAKAGQRARRRAEIINAFRDTQGTGRQARRALQRRLRREGLS